ncbi:Nramp family divalent metal transporter [Dictyobacter kobayashii]|uniref:Divalent metal cation transporter MntH n=1 Tax=Dictyobacter kobayashii TaxID=2014872 RepID=A0A402ABM8_9CHLR|nr:Nramp family divalent metal transporter [Dictyobacter kobayashii]GCE16497.1 divalent metal cation transporter MntH [Dictyobacter kobayashii]
MAEVETISSPQPTEGGWKRLSMLPSLSEVHATVPVPHKSKGAWLTMLAYLGPGLLVSVGYMDPGNWATDLAGGAQFGYLLISVILISNLLAIILQHLALKLGIVTGRDLAQACRDHYSRRVSFALWVLCEIAIAACDLAEVIGSAIALNLLFGFPLMLGVVLTALDVFVVLFLQRKGFRFIEALVGVLIFTIGFCFAYEILVSQPAIVPLLAGFIPRSQIVMNPSALYVSIGILGATVMPHNLYLHSSIVQTRAFERNHEEKARAIKFATIDSTGALFFAFFINAAILIVAAATFYGTKHANVADIGQAYQLLSPVLGVPVASTVFAIALLASGQNSTLTGTLAGQIVMEGFLNIRLRPWLRRLITRSIAIIPAIIVTYFYGAKGTGQLLILSQVILSFQLSFAVFPLVQFTNDKVKMGRFANPGWLKVLGWSVAIIIALLNAYLLFVTIFPQLAPGS